MKTTIKGLRSLIKEAIVKEEKVRSADGKEFTGDRDRIVKALVRFGSSGPERAAILSGQIPIGSAALQALKAAKAVKPVISPHVPSARSNTSRSRAPGSRSGDRLSAAAKRFAENWADFDSETPDTSPEDAASDAATGFFHDYPEWQQWAQASGMSKADVLSLVTDLIYDAMTKGR